MSLDAANDKLCWSIRDPDDDGFVWLIWEGEGPRQMLNLGSKEQVGEVLAKWLADGDFEG